MPKSNTMDSINKEQFNYDYSQQSPHFQASYYYNYLPYGYSNVYQQQVNPIDSPVNPSYFSYTSSSPSTNSSIDSSNNCVYPIQQFNCMSNATGEFLSPSSKYTATQYDYFSSTSNATSLYTSTPYQQVEIKKNQIQLNENSSSSSSNASVESNISPTIKKAEKRPRVIKLDLAKTSIGFGVAQKNNNRPETSDQCTSNPFKCTMCTQSFNIAAKLFMHQHKYHKNGSSLQCPICFKKFNSQANALVHLRAHTQEKTYKCHLCPLAFCDSSTLKKHVRTHTGEKPYECHLCTKKFTQSGNLKRHLAVHEKYDAIQAKNFPAVPTAYNSNTFY